MPRKDYYTMGNVGKTRYSVHFHDGEKTHGDGSPFYDLRIFSNKKERDAFIRSLTSKGYTERAH